MAKTKMKQLREKPKGPPPWERDKMRIPEVPVYLAHEYGVTVTVQTVYRWMSEGRKAKEGGGAVYLMGEKKMGRIYIKRIDLEAFVGSW